MTENERLYVRQEKRKRERDSELSFLIHKERFSAALLQFDE